MRPRVVVLAVVLLATVVAGVVLARRDEGTDPVLFNCGPEELTTPELVEPDEGVPEAVAEVLLDGGSLTALAVHPSGDLLVLDRSGLLLLVDPVTGDSEQLLDLETPTGAEMGGLGLAVAPDGDHLYLTYTPDLTGTLLVELALTADGVDPSTRRELLFQPNDRHRHLMSNLAFGPDGLLYVGVGDGAMPEERSGEVNPAGQDVTDIAGSILRIDPRPDGDRPYTVPPGNPFAGGEGAAEIYLYGVRNPWRFSFDPETGDLWVADAGEYCAEEITRIAAADQAGANLGWNTYEGPLRFDPDTETPDVVAPVHWYQRALGDPEAGVPARCAVIGGHVYRGAAFPELRGRYVFGDHCTGRLEVLDVAPDGSRRSVQTLVQLTALLQGIGVDGDGELVALTAEGAFRIVPG